MLRFLLIAIWCIGFSTADFAAAPDTFSVPLNTPRCLPVFDNDVNVKTISENKAKVQEYARINTTETPGTKGSPQLDASPYFLQTKIDSQAMIVVEAEDYIQQLNGESNIFDSSSWETNNNYDPSSGTGIVVLLPNTGSDTARQMGKMLRFPIAFQKAATYSVYVRGRPCSGCNRGNCSTCPSSQDSSSTSIHIGLASQLGENAAAVCLTCQNGGGFDYFSIAGSSGFYWSHSRSSASGPTSVELTVSASGVTWPPRMTNFFIAARDDGVVIDKFVLIQKGAVLPWSPSNQTDIGPSTTDTPLIQCGNTSILYIPPKDFTGLDSFSYTIFSQTGQISTAKVDVYVNQSIPITDDSSSDSPNTKASIGDGDGDNSSSTKKKSNNSTVIIATIIPIVSVLVLASILIAFLVYRRQRNNNKYNPPIPLSNATSANTSQSNSNQTSRNVSFFLGSSITSLLSPNSNNNNNNRDRDSNSNNNNSNSNGNSNSNSKGNSNASSLHNSTIGLPVDQTNASKIDGLAVLEELLMDPACRLLSLLVEFTKVTDIDLIADNLIQIFEADNMPVLLMQYMIEKEVKESEGALFRGTTISTSCLQRYIVSEAGMDFIKKTLYKPIKDVVDNPLRHEVDPKKISSNETLEENHKILLQTTEKFMDAILKSVANTPKIFRVLCKILWQELEKNLSTKDNRYSGVAQFMLVRLFCPAIVTGQELVSNTEGQRASHVLSGEPHRALIHVAKILQAISSGKQFGQTSKKEEYLSPFNAFVMEHQTWLALYIDKLTGLSDSDSSKITSFKVSSKQKKKSLVLVRSHLIQILPDLWEKYHDKQENGEAKGLDNQFWNKIEIVQNNKGTTAESYASLNSESYPNNNNNNNNSNTNSNTNSARNSIF